MRGADHEDDGKDSVLVEPAVNTAKRQGCGRRSFQEQADARNLAAVVTVSDMADQQGQEQGRKELHQTDHAEIESAMRELIDLPADGDDLHLIGDGGGDTRAPEQRKRAVVQNGF